MSTLPPGRIAADAHRVENIIAAPQNCT